MLTADPWPAGWEAMAGSTASDWPLLDWKMAGGETDSPTFNITAIVIASTRPTNPSIFLKSFTLWKGNSTTFNIHALYISMLAAMSWGMMRATATMEPSFTPGVGV